MNPVARSWAEVDLGAIRDNLRTLRGLATPGIRLAAVVKADAYGHGLAPVAGAAAREADLLAVANVTEARAVRAAGVALPVLVLGPALPEEREALVAGRFVPTLSTAAEVEAFAGLVPPGGEPLPVHLAIDTGMGRIGLWGDEVQGASAALRRAPSLRLDALSSHLPVPDEDPAYTDDQIRRFDGERTDHFRLPPGTAALLNSAGVLRFGQRAAPGDIVRVGLAMYGASPVPEGAGRLAPALVWKTRVSLVRTLGPGRSISYGRTFITPREMPVGTLAVGYGDGYSRHLSNRGAAVLIKGRRCPVLGRVTMDQIKVDLSGAGREELGEEAVLIGRQGGEEVTATELAERAGTIAWEVFTGITARVTRRHHGG